MYFRMCILNYKLFGHETGLIIDIAMGNIFRKYSARFWRTGSIAKPFLLYQPTTIKNQIW